VCAGLVGGAVFLVGLSFLDCTQTALAVTLLTLSLAVASASSSGFFVNNIDIAPLYAGTLMGVSNGIAAASGFIAPVVTAVITTDVRHSQHVPAPTRDCHIMTNSGALCRASWRQTNR